MRSKNLDTIIAVGFVAAVVLFMACDIERQERKGSNVYEQTQPVSLQVVSASPKARFWTVETTGYCRCKKCCGPNARGITASGKLVMSNGGHFVAAPSEVPFDVLVRIPGYAGNRPVPVLDRGKAIKGNRLDLFFKSHRAARAWGRKTLTVKVVP